MVHLCFMRCPIGHQGYVQLIRLTNKLISLPHASVCFQTTKCVLLCFGSDMTYVAVQNTQNAIMFWLKLLIWERTEINLDNADLIHFVPTTHLMCVNLLRACATVKITSHVPVISPSSRNTKTKKFMRVTCVLVRIQKKLLIRKNKTIIGGAAALIFCAFLALWETACIITVTYHTIERLH